MNQKANPETVQFRYTFEFENGGSKVFDITLDSATLELVQEKDIPRPEWTTLNFYPCEHCPLAVNTKYCPVAVNLSQMVLDFKDSVSHEWTRVTVETPERTVHERNNTPKRIELDHRHLHGHEQLSRDGQAPADGSVPSAFCHSYRNAVPYSLNISDRTILADERREETRLGSRQARGAL